MNEKNTIMKILFNKLFFLIVIRFQNYVFADENLTVAIQPFGKNKIIEKVQTGIENLYNVKVIILESKSIPEKSYFKPRNRYRAEKLLDFLDENIKNYSKIVGLTEKDISTTKGKIYDRGIFGLGGIKGLF